MYKKGGYKMNEYKSQYSGLQIDNGIAKANTALQSHQDISGKEDKTNKVTSISSSSTDTQYPSAKCVYDMIGDVETILTTLTTGSGV
jgi:hypothetical protein